MFEGNKSEKLWFSLVVLSQNARDLQLWYLCDGPVVLLFASLKALEILGTVPLRVVSRDHAEMEREVEQR